MTSLTCLLMRYDKEYCPYHAHTDTALYQKKSDPIIVRIASRIGSYPNRVSKHEIAQPSLVSGVVSLVVDGADPHCNDCVKCH